MQHRKRAGDCAPHGKVAAIIRFLVPPVLSRPSDGDLPTGQGLEANGKPAADTIRDGQRPVTLARASEPLNRHLKLNVPGMATWKGDELADEVHCDQAVGAQGPTGSLAPDVAGIAWRVTVLVNAVEFSRGRAIG